MPETQVLFLLNAPIFLAHSVTMVKFSSWQLFGQHRCLLSAKCAQKSESYSFTVGRNVT